MSRRAIKRFEQQQLDALAPSDEDHDQAADQRQASSNGNVKSMFALLSVDDDGSSEENNPQPSPSTDEREVRHESVKSKQAQLDDPDEGENEQTIDSSQLSEPSTVISKKKKKKKRKGRKRTGGDRAVDQQNDPDWIALNEFQKETEAQSASKEPKGFIPKTFFSAEDGQDVREEAKRIMLMIEAIAFPNQSSETQVTAEENVLKKTTSTVLHVEPRLLSADAELKRLFGSRVVDLERRDEDGAAARRRRAGGRVVRAKRKVSLVLPRDTWFDHAPGLIMDLDKDAPSVPGVRYFRYSYEPSYARLQEEYRSVLTSNNHEHLMYFVGRNPYHTDGLLQLAELHRQMGEVDRASDQIERCVYILEATWHVSFKPFDFGACRLSFDVVENRTMYIALFRYSQILTRRGLHRTSLEISKLLLNLDPENDPMGMLLQADSFALLSGEYDWVLQMRDEYPFLPIKYFPNFAASSTLAIEMRRTGKSKRGQESSSTGSTGRKLGTLGDSPDNNAVQADGTNNDTETQKAKDMLVDTLLTFPMLLRPLLKVVNDSSGVWTESQLYEEGWYSAGCEDGGVLNRIALVYGERSQLLWNAGNTKHMLIECAREAGQLDDAAGMGIDPDTGSLTPALVKDEVAHARVARCRALRVEAANWFLRSGLYGKVQVNDFADSNTNLSREVLADDIGAPEPPRAPREVSVGRGALEFLQSLLPWREARDARIDDDEPPPRN